MACGERKSAEMGMRKNRRGYLTRYFSTSFYSAFPLAIVSYPTGGCKLAGRLSIPPLSGNLLTHHLRQYPDQAARARELARRDPPLNSSSAHLEVLGGLGPIARGFVG